MNKNITIYIPKTILENKELNPLEKILLSITFSLSRKGKLGFNSYSNNYLSELLSVDSNSLGTHRKRLIQLGYERKEKGGKYFLDREISDGFQQGRGGGTILPPQIYKLKKLSSGAKLLWSLYNSLEKGTKGYCNAKRETLAKRLNCSVESITGWADKLNERDLFTHFELLSGNNSRQRVVKTRKFEKDDLINVTIGEVLPEVTVQNKHIPSIEPKQTGVNKVFRKMIKVTSAEQSDAESFWRIYMNDTKLIDFKNSVERTDFIWDLCNQISDNNQDEHFVISELLTLIDVKLKNDHGSEDLKIELKKQIKNE